MSAKSKAASQKTTGENRSLVFADNGLAQALFGPHQVNLVRLEKALDVQLAARGNQVAIIGGDPDAEQAEAVLTALYERLEQGLSVVEADVDAALRQAAHHPDSMAELNATIYTRKRPISPRSPLQADYIRAIEANDMVFGLGPAGTGKTYLAVAKAVESLINGKVDRIILSRPAVEAGEQLGFLPGSMQEKVDPYLRPLYDALYDMLPETRW